jgi:hypothetical protein
VQSGIRRGTPLSLIVQYPDTLVKDNIKAAILYYLFILKIFAAMARKGLIRHNRQNGTSEAA